MQHELAQGRREHLTIGDEDEDEALKGGDEIVANAEIS